jgi:acyl transferase domain-containing protein
MEPPATSRIQEPEFSQTVCTALQVALVDLLRSWSIEPVATVGHSSGMTSKKNYPYVLTRPRRDCRRIRRRLSHRC